MNRALTSPRLVFVGLLLLALLSAVVRSRPGYVLAVGDSFFVEPRPAVILERDPYLWADVNGGGPSTNVVQLPYRLWWALAGQLGVPAWLFQTLERGLYLAGAGLSIYLLAGRVWPGRPWAPVAAAAFYMFNIGRMELELLVHLEWLYVLLPLLLTVYLNLARGLLAGALAPALPWGLLLAALVGLVFPVILINLPQAVIVAGACLALALVTCLLAPRGRRALMVGGHFLVGGLAVVVSAWWLWPTVQYYVLSLAQGRIAAVIDPLAWAGTQVRSSFLNEMLLVPQWSWLADFIPVFDLYQHPLMRALLLVPALTALSALWAARRPAERRLTLLLLGLLLLLLLVGKGLHLPGLSFNRLAYQAVPGMWLLREPWGKIFCFVAVVLALLIGLAVDGLWQRLSAGGQRSRRAGLLVLPLLGLFPLAVFPWFVRTAIYRASDLLASPQIEIPAYWFEAARALQPEAQAGRLLLAPGNNFYAIPYTWGSYFADGLADRLLPLSTLSRDFGYIQFNAAYSDLLDRVYQALEDPASELDPTQALALLNVRYVLVRGDMAAEQPPLGGPVPDPRLAGLRARLQALPDVHLARTFGALELYQLSDERFLPRLYVPDQIAVIASVTDLVALPVSGAAPARAVYLGPADASRQDWQQAVACRPALTFAMIDPTRYEAVVDGACAAYVLVFSSNYNANWRASIVTPGAAVELIPDTHHLRANGYANAWLIQTSGAHTVVIDYYPQRRFELSLLVTSLGLALMVVVLLVVLARRRTLGRAARGQHRGRSA